MIELVPRPRSSCRLRLGKIDRHLGWFAIYRSCHLSLPISTAKFCFLLKVVSWRLAAIRNARCVFLRSNPLSNKIDSFYAYRRRSMRLSYCAVNFTSPRLMKFDFFLFFPKAIRLICLAGGLSLRLSWMWIIMSLWNNKHSDAIVRLWRQENGWKCVQILPRSRRDVVTV